MHVAPCSAPAAEASQPPTVSILMPAWNAARFLAAAVESVVAQAGEIAWELLIVDDGSTDGTLALARELARGLAGRARVLRHAQGGNHGTSAARNLALAHARGEVIALLDSDDVWLPHMLQHQLALLERWPAADLVYANAERSWDLALPCLPGAEGLGDNELPPLLPAGARAGLLPRPWPLPWFLAEETLTPCTCTVLVRREAALAVGGFADCFDGLYDDQAFYAKLMLRGQTAVSTECVARYRRHADSCCGQVWHQDAAQARARARFEAWLEAYRAELARETTRDAELATTC